MPRNYATATREAWSCRSRDVYFLLVSSVHNCTVPYCMFVLYVYTICAVPYCMCTLYVLSRTVCVHYMCCPVLYVLQV